MRTPFILLAWYFILTISPVVGQEIDLLDLLEADTAYARQWESIRSCEGITMYEAYNPYTGGEEIRMKNGVICTGLVIDYYPDSTIKHKGYYSNGVITSTYTNYFPGGSVERTFRPVGARGGVLHIFYTNDTLRSEVSYLKGRPVTWADYYPNGQPEFYEAYRKDLKTLITRKFYYSTGESVSELLLVDKKRKRYSYFTWFPNGQSCEEGTFVIRGTGSRMWKTGVWKQFDREGNLLSSTVYDETEQEE